MSWKLLGGTWAGGWLRLLFDDLGGAWGEAFVAELGDAVGAVGRTMGE